MNKIWSTFACVAALMSVAQCEGRDICDRLQTRSGHMSFEPEAVRNRKGSSRPNLKGFQCRILQSSNGIIQSDSGLEFEVAEGARSTSNQWSQGQRMDIRRSLNTDYPLQIKNLSSRQTVLARQAVSN